MQLWNLDGSCDDYYTTLGDLTLVETPKFNDKDVILCWNNNEAEMRIRFYDKIYNSTFFYDGTRNGLSFDNYKIMENPHSI